MQEALIIAFQEGYSPSAADNSFKLIVAALKRYPTEAEVVLLDRRRLAGSEKRLEEKKSQTVPRK